MSEMKALLDSNPMLLMEAAIVEQLRRSSGVQLHPLLANAALIYDQAAGSAMAAIYRQYMQLAEQAGLPMLVCTPTWRADRERVLQSAVSESINADAVAFMRSLGFAATVRIGGMTGCKNDCYQPGEALSTTQAEHYHAWQIQQLAAAGVDFLIAVTLPNVNEALGIARAMSSTGLPYIISFVIGRDAHVLDGTSLADAISYIDGDLDQQAKSRPLGYMVNCAHPSFLRPETQPADVFRRLIGYQANASSLDHCELDQADALRADNIAEWAGLMKSLNADYGVRVLGGCCGTGSAHLQALVSLVLEK